jgi:hypothetical protein
MHSEALAAVVTVIEPTGQAINRIFIATDRMVLPIRVVVAVVAHCIHILPGRVFSHLQVGLE